MVPTSTPALRVKATPSFFLMQVLICRNYRGDVDMSEVEHFMPILMEKEEEGMLSPILAHGGVRFMWIKHNNLYCIPVLRSGGLGVTGLRTSTGQLGSQRAQTTDAEDSGSCSCGEGGIHGESGAQLGLRLAFGDVSVIWGRSLDGVGLAAKCDQTVSSQSGRRGAG